MKPAIRVDNLSKLYRVGARPRAEYRTLRESLTRAASAPWRRMWAGTSSAAVGEERDYWALRDVSFEIAPGEVVGIIGRNGAGKSTLLKILSRITEPTAGRIEFRGRIGSLLEVGTGFHPELTGRENIYLSGATLGMGRREIARKFDAIVEFAEIGRFLDTPVKRYSSGMYVRLAFAVAAHLEPEILLVDEVLAVGDVGFQKKCLGRMQSISEGGRTVVFVSHNVIAVESLCDRCILLNRGRLEAQGRTEQILASYNAIVSNGDGGATTGEFPGRTKDSRQIIKSVRIVDNTGNSANTIGMDEAIEFEVAFESFGAPLNPVLGIVFKNGFGAAVCWANSRYSGTEGADSPTEAGSIACRIDPAPFMPGSYSIDLYLGGEDRDSDVIHDAAGFRVTPADILGIGKLPPPSAGSLFLPARWELRC